MSAPFAQRCRCRIRRHCSSSCNSIWRRILRVRGLWVWNCTRSRPRPTERSMASFFRKRRSRDRLEVMLARMRKLLGEQPVGSPELTDDHRPNAFRMAPVSASAAASQREAVTLDACSSARLASAAHGRRCTCERCTCAGLLGLSCLCCPRCGRAGSVSGQWWSEANWCREEWDVRLESGRNGAALSHRLRSALPLLVFAGDV